MAANTTAQRSEAPCRSRALPDIVRGLVRADSCFCY